MADNELFELACRLVQLCCDRGVTVATAESLTAGMVSSAIADVPGASAVLRGGAVTYCDEVKHAVLGVSAETLERFSAVSADTAREMCLGARSLFGTDMAVSFTGYAGPAGGTDADPAGTVYIGLSSPSQIRVHRFGFEGNRNDVRRAASIQALRLLIDELVDSE